MADALLLCHGADGIGADFRERIIRDYLVVIVEHETVASGLVIRRSSRFVQVIT